MGSPHGDLDRGHNEGWRRVALSRGYWIADTTCTQALWHRVTGSNPSEFRGAETLPVEHVSWVDVTHFFLPRLNSLVPGLSARLPTEAEWEYACRAGRAAKSTQYEPFWFGAQASTEWLNFRMRTGQGGLIKRTHPVGSLPPNPWGLFEMHGNVWEWCSDGYADQVRYNTEETDPRGPRFSSHFSLRGGSWYNEARRCRAAARDARDVDFSAGYVGLRLCLGE
jgi:formylglycine-generating enzyme